MSTDYKIKFDEIKATISVEKACEILGIPLKSERSQLRGVCPVCQGGPRSLAVTPGKGWFCQGACKRGGDVIRLVALARGIKDYEAAVFLSTNGTVSTVPQKRGTVGTVPPAPTRKGFDVEQYAASLDAAHASLEPLGLSPETLQAWKAGYAKTGLNRGRLALPIRSNDGEIVGFCGRALTSDQQPALIFPNGLDPHDHIFGVDRVVEGKLFLANDVLTVLHAYQNDANANVIAPLTEDFTAQQLEQLASLIDQRHCETIAFF